MQPVDPHPIQTDTLATRFTQGERIVMGGWAIVTPKPAPLNLDYGTAKILRGSPVLRYIPPRVEISTALTDKLTPKQVDALKADCMAQYRQSMAVLDASIADAAVANPTSKEFAARTCRRLYTVLEKYAEVLADEEGLKGLSRDLRFDRLLADTYLQGSPKTRDYAGNIGSNPVAIRKALLEGNFREQMFLILNAKKGPLTDLLADAVMVRRVNEKLFDARTQFQIRHDRSITDDGVYAALTDEQGLRIFDNRSRAWKAANPTIGESAMRLRVPLSDREARYQAQEATIRPGKEDVRLNWSAGTAVFRPSSVKKQPDNGYLAVAAELGLPMVAGVSGTTDQVLTVALNLGFSSRREMYEGRLASLGWFLDTNSHSAYEVLTSAQSFGLRAVASPDFYKEIDPLNTGFDEALVDAHRRRGFELPATYLEAAHVKAQARTLGMTE